jgi:hypothetical protein
MMSERIQAFIHKLESDAGARWMNYCVLVLLVLALAVWYDVHCYHNFNSPEAMDAAQVGRQLAQGHGFTTDCVRPFSVHLLQEHNHASLANLVTNGVDTAGVFGRHPDLANAPVYPLVLAGLFSVIRPDWNLELHRPFWSDGGNFLRYKPEFVIALFNQLLLLVAVCLTFLIAKNLFDASAAWLSAILVLCSDTLWKYSVSGLPTLLLLVIFLGLIWCLATYESLGRAEQPDERRRLGLAVGVGLFAALGMLTRYSFGWVMLPALAYFMFHGGPRRANHALVATVVFLAAICPWLARNEMVSGTLFGTAGYALLENTYVFPGSNLLRSLNPDLNLAYARIASVLWAKFDSNARSLLRDALPQLGGGAVGVLFLAGLLLGLRNVVARRLRYFTLMCVGVFFVVTALGQTGFSSLAPEANTENLFVLLIPLAVMFGVAFFLTLLSQMNLPMVQLRYAVILLVVLLLRAQFVLTLLPPKTRVVSYPPYNPPDVQTIAGWMRPDELLMSDVPWAVAWYGNDQCIWTTLNWNSEFTDIDTFIKPVGGLYLTLVTMDGHLVTDCLQAGQDDWGYFAFRTLAFNRVPDRFPLRHAPPTSLVSGLFLTDHNRW